MRHVIIVARDLLLAADFVGILEEAGHAAAVACDCRQALQTNAAIRVDAALIDVDGLDAGDCLDLAWMLLDHHRATTAFVGAAMEWEFMQAARRHRAVGFIRKPYAGRDIVALFDGRARDRPAGSPSLASPSFSRTARLS